MLIRLFRKIRREAFPFLCALSVALGLFTVIAIYSGVWSRDTSVVMMTVRNEGSEISSVRSKNENSTVRVIEAVSAEGTERASPQGLIRFDPFVYDPVVENFTRDIAHEYQCVGPVEVPTGNIEDLMCRPRPKFLPEMKNPCYRNVFGKLRCLPYFFLLGFDKCGTTDFHSRLTSHPQVLPNDAHMGKEIYYWPWRRYGIFMKGSIEVLSLEEYMSIFSEATKTIESFQGSPNPLITGDGGPIDLWDFRAWPREPQNRGLTEPKVLAPHHIRHLLQDPKFIVMVRDPVERTYSDYLFLSYGETAKDFDRDVPIAIDMMTSCLEVNSSRLCFFSDDLYKRMPVRLHISCYSIFLREWLAVFHRRHFFILRTEDYHEDTKGSLQAAFAFLGVDPLSDKAMEELLNLKKKFETTKKKTAGVMSEKTRKMLEDFYAPCTKDLRDLLGDDRFLFQKT